MNKFRCIWLLFLCVLLCPNILACSSSKPPYDAIEKESSSDIASSDEDNTEKWYDTLLYDGFVASMEKDTYPTDASFIRLVLTAEKPGVAFVYMCDTGYIYRIENGEEIYLGGYTNEVCGTAVPESPDGYAIGICGVSLQSLRVNEGVTFYPGQYRVKYEEQVLDFKLVAPESD